MMSRRKKKDGPEKLYTICRSLSVKASSFPVYIDGTGVGSLIYNYYVGGLYCRASEFF